MKIFECANCANVLYFENRFCGACGLTVGFHPASDDFVAVRAENGRWDSVSSQLKDLRFCANADHDACNWFTDTPEHAYCVACSHNEIVPDLTEETARAAWRELEIAKHRLFYSLLRLQLPSRGGQRSANALVFQFLADPPNSDQRVLTGHEDGRITIAVAEADNLEREKRRVQMGEPYRTLLGHFRHEVGHHFWDVLVRDGNRLDQCREIFGDERRDYQESLQTHYANGAPQNWQETFVSGYAASHPWEDFAETWAHYLHIVDSLETAHAFGVTINPTVKLPRLGQATFDPYTSGTLNEIIDAWLPFVLLMNSTGRTLGHADLYPFVLNPTVMSKLDFIHRIIRENAAV